MHLKARESIFFRPNSTTQILESPDNFMYILALESSFLHRIIVGSQPSNDKAVILVKQIKLLSSALTYIKLSGHYKLSESLFECGQRGFLDSALYHFTNTDLEPIRCAPNYCIIPSYGKWPVNKKKQEGTVVTMGVECEGENNTVNDDHVLIPYGAKCKVSCKAENGKAYRTDTTFGDIQCNRILNDQNLFDANGCNSKKNFCESDWIEDPLQKTEYTTRPVNHLQCTVNFMYTLALESSFLHPIIVGSKRLTVSHQIMKM